MRPSHTLALLLLLAGPAVAAENEAPPPPPMPAEEAIIEEATGLEPEVTIKQSKEEVVQEYRVNGRLVMVKITPTTGYPYYLFDTDGDGSLETRRNSLDNPPVNQWNLLRW